jgi:hypothetical protein
MIGTDEGSDFSSLFDGVEECDLESRLVELVFIASHSPETIFGIPAIIGAYKRRH